MSKRDHFTENSIQNRELTSLYWLIKNSSRFSSRWRTHEPLVICAARAHLIQNSGSSDETRRNSSSFPYMYESLSLHKLSILCSSDHYIVCRFVSVCSASNWSANSTGKCHSYTNRVRTAREYSGKTKQIRGESQYKYKFAGIF